MPDPGGHFTVCPKDGTEHFPRTDPAVIMLVTDPEDRCLLAALQARELALPPSVSIARHIIEAWYGGPLPSSWTPPVKPPRS